MIVLDTCVLSAAFRRTSKGTRESAVVAQLRQLIEDDVRIGVPGIVFQKLLSGVKGEAGVGKLKTALQGFELLLADVDDHEEAASLTNTCRFHGVSAHAVDSLIAAQTIRRGGSLFTTDTDFKRIAKHSKLQLLD